MTEEQIETLLEEFFTENLKAIQLEGGHALAPEVKETARWQVKLYWRKLREVAEKVTDTEVKLSLPQQKTPNTKRIFGIEGVVDIVRENDQVVMYDIKTHEADEIRNRPDMYRAQLNVYAYIWEELHEERLDATAIICTAYPQTDTLRNAIQARDDQRIAAELEDWDPIIDLDFNADRALATIREFAAVVEQIENHEFTARPPADLLQPDYPGARAIFAVNTCRNCDARFSCSSYRQYALGSRGSAERKFQQYYADLGTDEEREDFLTSALNTTPILTEADEYLE